MRIIFVKLKRKKYDELSIRATIYLCIAILHGSFSH